ncbi:MAG: hypothetical protein EOP53_20645, partial [Sphingobacteriales bacterium]
MAIIVVVNHLKDFPGEIPGVEAVTAKSYLTEPKYSAQKNARVFNLCRNYSYQSTGYYISLLAMARGHKVMPDITTIQDTKTQSIIRIKSEELGELIQKSLAGIEEKDFELDICFGKTLNEKFSQFLGNINVHGISPYMPPPLRGGGASEGLSLQLWSDPTCNSTMEVTLKVDVLGSAGKL